jgi:hypothetical protein
MVSQRKLIEIKFSCEKILSFLDMKRSRERETIDNTIRFQYLLESQDGHALEFADQCNYDLNNSLIYVKGTQSIFQLFARWCKKSANDLCATEMFDLLLCTKGYHPSHLNIWDLIESDGLTYTFTANTIHCFFSRPMWFPMVPEKGCIGIAHITQSHCDKVGKKLNSEIPIYLLWQLIINNGEFDLYRSLNEEDCYLDDGLQSHPILPLACAIRAGDERLLCMILQTFPVVQLDVFARNHAHLESRCWHSIEDWLDLFNAKKLIRCLAENARSDQLVYLSNVRSVVKSHLPQEISETIYTFIDIPKRQLPESNRIYL